MTCDPTTPTDETLAPAAPEPAAPEPAAPEPAAPEPAARICVLASGSAGNCTLLALGSGHRTRLCLIDAGLSPKRTRRLLADYDLRLDHIDDILLTHLDRDHYHPGWNAASLHGRVRFRMHHTHTKRAHRLGIPPGSVTTFDAETFSLRGEADVTPVTLAHDELGVAAFRFDWKDTSLGFATDLGRVTQELIDAFQCVGTLAIESNYCPRLQLASDRPEFLKARIMNGAGHISNEQALDAIRDISPQHHVVLIHLSRQCNSPDLARSLHAGAHYSVTAAQQFEPTGWIELLPNLDTDGSPSPARTLQMPDSLFDLPR